MLKRRTVAGHLLCGILGFGCLAAALVYASRLGWWTAVPLIVALVCFQGCPMCWTVGLIVTVVDRKKSASCVDGSCAIAKPTHAEERAFPAPEHPVTVARDVSEAADSCIEVGTRS
jgi:hypothetical protein